MENINIQEIEQQFNDEWLLFEVYETDEMNRPTKGKLIAHSPLRAALDEYWGRVEVKLPYVTYSGDRPRKGLVSVL